MAEKSYLNTNLDANPTAQTQAPLYYTDQQMAQMLKPPPDPLSQIAGPANVQSILPQLYAQQANQADQPQGYRRGGTVASLHVNADMPNFAHLAKGGLPNIPIPVVDDRTAIDALMRDKSILSRYNVDPQTVPPERKPAVPKPAPGQGEERDDEGFVPGHAKGGLIGPTEAQRHAGNYKKTHGHVRGIPIAIENPVGSVRSGKGADGKPWSVTMPHHYGYFKRTEGKDGDQVDVHVGPHIETDQVHVIDQVHPDTGKFDEHKVMMGFRQPHEAVHAYHSSFSDGKAHLRMGGMVSMHVNDFKKWLADKHATKRPAAKRTGGIRKSTKRSGILQRFADGGQVEAADDNYFGVVPMLKEMIQTSKIPGQVLYGERQPTNDDALNMAMMATGAGAGALRGTGAVVAPAMAEAAPEAVDMDRRGILKGMAAGAPMDYGDAADLHANGLVDAYHVTSPDNLKGIMKTGLGWGNDRPFITTDPNEADAFKNYQLDDNDSKVIHLKIPADKFAELDPVTDYNMSDAGTSYHIRPISKDKIAQWLHAVYDDIPDDILEKKAHGGLIQNFAAGGPVMPAIKRYPSFLPGNNYVPPMPHYRDALGNTEMSATRNALQNMVR